jgi:hypothetical protein
MQKDRNRLLVTLILVLVATATAWTVSEARIRAGADGPPGSVFASSLPKAGLTSTSGEPDQPKATMPPLNPQSAIQAQPGWGTAWDRIPGWLRWVSRIRAALYLGVAF